MATTLQFTDGSTTVNLTSGASGYGLLHAEWMPRVATRRISQMAGNSPYNPVREEMRITIEGSSTTNLLSNLQTLVDLFDQANLWYQDDSSTTAVTFKYKHNDSSTTVSQVIYDAEIELPFNFTAIAGSAGYKIGTKDDPVTLRFTRPGLWIGATEAEVTSTSTGNPVIQTSATFTDTFNIPVPYDIDIDFSGRLGDTAGAPYLHIATTNAADKLYTIECESMTGANSQAVAGSSAGSVSQQADSGTETLTDSSFDMNDDARLYAFFIMVKSSAGITNWTLTAKLYLDDSLDETVSASKPVVFSGNSQTMVAFSPIATNWKPGRLVVTAEPDSNEGETLDLDYIVGVALDESTNILKVTPILEEPSPAFGSGDEFNLDQRVLTNKKALVTLLDTSVIEAYPAYNGSAYPYASGNAISAIAFGNSPSKYILYDYGNTKEADVTFTFTRSAGYLTPL